MSWPMQTSEGGRTTRSGSLYPVTLISSSASLTLEEDEFDSSVRSMISEGVRTPLWPFGVEDALLLGPGRAPICQAWPATGREERPEEREEKETLRDGGWTGW
jgi:hypothetical protein